MTDSMRIVSLEAENILRLNAIYIEPKGNILVIGGKNAQGKSSVLKCIEMALNGIDKKNHPMPLKQGAEKGYIICDLGDIVVTRNFTKKGSILTVKTKDGARYDSPQKMLSKLTGEISFDPVAWNHMESKKQLELLKQLVGLDFTDKDASRKKLYEERTIINTAGKKLKADFDAMPEVEEIKKVVVADLMTTLEERKKTNIANKESRDNLAGFKKDLADDKQNVLDKETVIQRLQAELVILNTIVSDTEKTIEIQEKEIAKLIDANEEEISDQIKTAEATNKQAEDFQKRIDTEKELKEKREESQTLTNKITAIDDEKTKAMSEAKFPVPGLSFDEDGVIFNGIPFTQASDAEKLRVSVAMGIAMNPTLKVILIRDGSLLDEDNLKLIAQMAEEADAYVWIERVSKGTECQVIIEDGRIEE